MPKFPYYGTPLAPFPPPCLREWCAEASVGTARVYMCEVREVEGQLRRQSLRVTQEGIKLERARGHLEKMLDSLRRDLQVNKWSVEGRTMRPPSVEKEKDGADYLLDCERRELSELKQVLENTLRNVLSQFESLAQCSRQLLDCACERARVLELLPALSGSHSAGGRNAQAFAKTNPIGPFTPECNQVLESSSLEMSQSQLLRDNIRHQMLPSAIIRQRDAHLATNNGLVKKIAETINQKQNLTVMYAATRQTVALKQRQIDSIRHSHDRSLGPEYSEDIVSHEKLNRPLVQVYQRHPGTELPETAHLLQGTAVLRRTLLSSEGELASLQGFRLNQLDNLHGKSVAAQVDSAVVRMRRQFVDKRAMPITRVVGKKTGLMAITADLSTDLAGMQSMGIRGHLNDFNHHGVLRIDLPNVKLI